MDKYRYGSVIVNTKEAFNELERRALLLPYDKPIKLDSLFAEERTWLHWHGSSKQDELRALFIGASNTRTKEHYTYVQRVYKPAEAVVELYRLQPLELICSYCVLYDKISTNCSPLQTSFS